MCCSASATDWMKSCCLIVAMPKTTSPRVAPLSGPRLHRVDDLAREVHDLRRLGVPSPRFERAGELVAGAGVVEGDEDRGLVGPTALAHDLSRTAVGVPERERPRHVDPDAIQAHRVAILADDLG